MAVARAGGLAEHSIARSTPMPPVSSLTWATLSGPAVNTASQKPRSMAIFIRSGFTSMPMIFWAPSLRQIAAVASPTGPRPVMSTA